MGGSTNNFEIARVDFSQGGGISYGSTMLLW
jgi:hypothetical protein